MDFKLPVGEWAEALVNFILDNFQPALDFIAEVVDGFGGAIDSVLTALPDWLIVTLLVGWRFGGSAFRSQRSPSHRCCSSCPWTCGRPWCRPLVS